MHSLKNLVVFPAVPGSRRLVPAEGTEVSMSEGSGVGRLGKGENIRGIHRTIGGDLDHRGYGIQMESM